MFDYVIVGAGFVGATLAERIAAQLGKKVLIIEKRNHIGGNAYDHYDEHGILVHKYGPHIFHTRSREVWDYLSQFTEWNIYQHKVLGRITGDLVPIPFNLNSLYQVFPKGMASRLEQKLVENFGINTKVPILKLREIDDPDLQQLADFIYKHIFLHYTMKQWGVTPEELDPTVTGRVPVHISRDNRYFQDPYQGMPKYGYTALFEKMLNHPNIKLMLNTDYKEIVDIRSDGGIKLFGNPFEGKVIYTGPIDYFFDHKFGKLPYRSLNFKFETHAEEYIQPCGTVNYPNDYEFTRITEFKHLTSQKADNTTVVYEYPEAYEQGTNDPYYPIKNDDNISLYKQYKREGSLLKDVYFAGRLADYQYYDMDAAVARALSLFKEISSNG
jgi:UDP-galactopyranose mutase